MATASAQTSDEHAAVTKAPKLSAKRWQAESNTAVSITGDVTIGLDQIVLGASAFPLQLVREVEKAQLKGVGEIVNQPQPSSAFLYRTSIPRDKTLLHGNKLCGPNDVRWMLSVFAEKQLRLAFFSGESEPNLDPKVVASGHELCGTFGYSSSD